MIAKNCFYVVKAKDGRKRHKILDEVHLNTWLPKVIKEQVEMLAEKKLSADKVVIAHLEAMTAKILLKITQSSQVDFSSTRLSGSFFLVLVIFAQKTKVNSMNYDFTCSQTCQK